VDLLSDFNYELAMMLLGFPELRALQKPKIVKKNNQLVVLTS
jgi:hypothetical protein